jgi:hypothetical protein
VQAVVLSVTCTPLLSAWGAAEGSTVHQYALEFLRLRALFAPATVMLLVLQVRQKLVESALNGRPERFDSAAHRTVPVAAPSPQYMSGFSPCILAVSDPQALA